MAPKTRRPILRSRCPKSGLCFHGKIISSRTEYYICIVWLSARRHSSVVITTLTNHNQRSTWCQVLENGVRACARRVVFHKESILLTLKRNAPNLIEVWILIIWSVSYDYLIVISDSYVELREIYFPIVITYFGMNCESWHLCSRSMSLHVKKEHHATAQSIYALLKALPRARKLMWQKIYKTVNTSWYG